MIETILTVGLIVLVAIGAILCLSVAAVVLVLRVVVCLVMLPFVWLVGLLHVPNTLWQIVMGVGALVLGVVLVSLLVAGAVVGSALIVGTLAFLVLPVVAVFLFFRLLGSSLAPPAPAR